MVRNYIGCESQLYTFCMDIIDFPSTSSRDNTILEVREFSRRLVRELGFMRSTLADSDLAPSAVHAVIEIGMKPGLSSKDLGLILRLDKSNTSRQVAKLEASGFVKRRTAMEDARAYELYLTEEGEVLRARIDRFATSQVSDALRRIVPADQQTLLRSLSLYAEALAKDNEKKPPASKSQSANIVAGYHSGCIGDITSMHARFYSANWGFGSFFEKKVATELAEFGALLPAEGKMMWLYIDDSRVVASLIIDGDIDSRVAHLRWFIVDDSLRGTGVGRELMLRAMQFVDEHRFDETYLWTFQGLNSARHLYEAFGFRLTDESEGAQWGRTVVEQRFSRRILALSKSDAS
jgi:DNA-binding MarR family transcriptional regulator/GNAT superfamily N-acetyltransferase